MDKNPPADTGNMDSSPDSGRFHEPQAAGQLKAWPQPLSPHSVAGPLRQETPQREVGITAESGQPCSRKQRKPTRSEDPAQSEVNKQTNKRTY